MKSNIYAATVINYTTEQGKRYFYTTHTTSWTQKSLIMKLEWMMMNNNELSGIESYTIHDRTYTVQEAKELRYT